MSIRKILYPLDFTGTATTNRIEGELKTIGTDKYRAFTLNFAPFYTSNLTIKERGKTTLLKRGTDYECLYFYPELTKLAAGKEVCGVIVITNSNIGTGLEIGYNTVGGHYAHSAEVIQMAIEALELDNRNVYWQDVIDTPDLFQPTPHNHDLGDIYGMEFMIDTLVAIREAIMIGDNEVHQQIYNRIDSIVNSLTTMLNAHRSDYTNPHRTTAHQVNAYTMEEVDAAVAELMEDLANLEPRFQSITTQFTAVTQSIAAVNASLSGLSNRVGTVENEHSKFYLLLGAINTSLAAHQAAIDDLVSEVARLDGVDENLQAQINALKTRTTNVETKNATQNDRLDVIESLNTAQNTRLTNIETKNATQDDRLTALETLTTSHTNSILGVVSVNNTQNTRLTALESTNATQNTRISDLEKNPSGVNLWRSGFNQTLSWGTLIAPGQVYVFCSFNIAAKQPGYRFVLRIRDLKYNQYNHKYHSAGARFSINLNGVELWGVNHADSDGSQGILDLEVNIPYTGGTLTAQAKCTYANGDAGGVRAASMMADYFVLTTYDEVSNM